MSRARIFWLLFAMPGMAWFGDAVRSTHGWESFAWFIASLVNCYCWASALSPEKE